MKPTHQVTAIINLEGDAYVAVGPELDVTSQGQTIECARIRLTTALELFFESADLTDASRRLHSNAFVTRV